MSCKAWMCFKWERKLRKGSTESNRNEILFCVFVVINVVSTWWHLHISTNSLILSETLGLWEKANRVALEATWKSVLSSRLTALLNDKWIIIFWSPGQGSGTMNKILWICHSWKRLCFIFHGSNSKSNDGLEMHEETAFTWWWWWCFS